MSFFSNRRRATVLGIGILAALALGAYFFLDTESLLSEEEAAKVAAEAGHELSASGVEIEMQISVDVPGGEPSRKQNFVATGVVDFEGDVASLTYDFKNLTNAAGFFGHLDAFDVVFDTDHVYVQIFEAGRSWVSFRPADMVGLDMGRLLDVVLSTPLAVPDYLRNLRELSGNRDGQTTVIKGAVVPSILMGAESEATVALQRLMEELEAETILVTSEINEGSVTEITYELHYPVGVGAPEDVVARVAMDIRSSEARDVIRPPQAETRPITEFLD